MQSAAAHASALGGFLCYVTLLTVASPWCIRLASAYSVVNIPQSGTRQSQKPLLTNPTDGSTPHARIPASQDDSPLWPTLQKIQASRQQEMQQRHQQPQHPPFQPINFPASPSLQHPSPQWSRDPRDRAALRAATPDREYNGYGAEPDKDISNIFRQNQEWKHSKLRQDPFFFNKLGSVHKPRYMWIGCSDARVAANEIMGEDPGSVFVLRNVANLVIATDVNLMAGLQYAVDNLCVDSIIVCGHYDCGGIRASMETKDHVPPLENWLRNIRDVYRLHRDELNSIPDPEHRHRRLVELNVIEQCLNLFKTGVVQRRRVQTFRDGKNEYTTPRIHACVFDPRVGYLYRLPVDFSSYIRELHNIYDLYTLDGNGAAGPGELVRADGRPYDWGSESAEGKMGSLRIRSDGPSDVTVDFTFNKDGTIRLL